VRKANGILRAVSFHGHREHDLPVELHVEHGSVDGLFLKAAPSLRHLSEWSDYLIAV
jgi:hypothetical protein